MQGLHQGKSLRLWGAVLASSMLYAAAHPPWSLAPLALVAVAPVSAVLLDRRARSTPRRAALAGLLFGAASTWLLVGGWSFAAARLFFDGSTASAFAFAAALPLLASAVALPYALAFALISRLAGLGATAGVIGSAALWTGAEWARSTWCTGNPWGSFAAALQAVDASISGPAASETPVSALLGVGGPPLVAFAASVVGAALGLAWSERRDRRASSRALASGSLTLLLLVSAAEFALPMFPRRSPAAIPREPLRVAIVQSGIGGAALWGSSGAATAFDKQLQLTRTPDTLGADLIVWPENALPFLLDANPERKAALQRLARERGSALLVGGSRSGGDGRGGSVVHNSAFLFPADGGEPAIYDKRLLLPYVERVPSWAAVLLRSRWQGAFTEGRGPGTFTVKDWRIAPLLCFEAIYPSEVAARAREGADLLVNMSNDSWFDEGAGRDQHFSLALLAAAETRRPLVRVANTGISALVTEDGLVGWTMPTQTAGVALIDVPPPARDSLFVRGGETGAMLLVALLVAGAALLPRLSGRDPAAG